jgi:hypothetical protein
VAAIPYPLDDLYREMFFIMQWCPIGYRDMLMMTHVDRVAWVVMCDHKRAMDEKRVDEMTKGKH